jgi:hypothetical protein
MSKQSEARGDGRSRALESAAVAACTSRDSPHTLSRQARRIPAPKERFLHQAVVGHLRLRGAPDWRWTHPASGEKRDIRTAQKLRSMGVQCGWPDLILVAPDGRAHFLELKRQGGRLSDEQRAFRLHCAAMGWPFCWTSSIDEALGALEAWGALRLDIQGGRHG